VQLWASPFWTSDRFVTTPSQTEITLRVPSNHLMVDLLGERDTYLRTVEAAIPEVRIVARGNELDIAGPEREATIARTVFEELLILVQEGESLDHDRVTRVIDLVKADVPSPSGIFTDAIKVGRGRMVRSKTLGQKRYVDAVREHTLVFGIGPAGTGKTYLAMACAVEGLVSGAVRRIILTRPAVEAGERLGFLPGDLAAKVDPYLRPLYDALYEMLGPEETARLMERGTIEIAPLAYMRGRTLNDAFIVLDEAQNTSPEQMKMFLTRLGFNSKMVITGDVTQIDLADGKSSGLRAVQRILHTVDGIAFIELTGEDVVRHRLVAAIVEAYGRYEALRKRAEEAAAEGTQP
jgi:phosphate starvation-inducible PhoH-like protein